MIYAVERADDLHGVLIKGSFVEFIEKQYGEFFRLDGSDIHDHFFAKSFQLMS